ncbi:MAG: vitamin K epoxide reductase family protein [Streptomycetaceae bacterium]|nr:vitamin K epoxide reductase family protein [Streptomycetaceae bacterium]
MPVTSSTRVIVPGWLPVTGLLLAATGAAVSAYLTVEHFTGSASLACPDRGAVDCVKVTTSAQSTVFGVPVALLGLLFYLAVLPLLLPAAWRHPRAWPGRLRLAAVTSGIMFVLYLLYAELFLIGSICLWCTAVHAITAALFAVVLLGGALIERP